MTKARRSIVYREAGKGSKAVFGLEGSESPLLIICEGMVLDYCADSLVATLDPEIPVSAPSGLGDSAFACRIEPGDGSDVVQLGVGKATSRLMDSLYDPMTDTAIRFHADGLSMKWDGATWIVSASGLREIEFRPDFMRDSCQLDYYQPLDRSVFRRAPTGWCSWTAYLEPDWNAGVGLSENQVMLNADWAAENLRQFGFEYIQIDDGWQENSPYRTRIIAQEFRANRPFDGYRMKFNRGGTCVWQLRKDGRDGAILATGTWLDLEGEGAADAMFDTQPPGDYCLEIIGVPDKPGVGWHSIEADSNIHAEVYIDGDAFENVQLGFGLRHEDGWNTVVSTKSSLLSLGLNAGGTLKNRSFDRPSQNFQRGMKHVADYVKSRGLRPGIWLVPFGQSDPELFESTPQMFLRDDRGRSPLAQPVYGNDGKQGGPVFWLGRYCIDPTTGEAADYFRELFTRISSEWGYDYIKIDGQGHAMGVLRKYMDRLHEPVETPIEAYRRGVEVMKESIGKDVFLLNCGGVYDSCGLCEGIRTGADIVPRWEGVLRCVKATCRSLLFNSIAFWTDPDMICVRNDIPYEHAQAWATYLAITGQLLMVSDRLYDLHADRLELLRRILPVADIHPAELYRLDEAACVYDLKVEKPGVGSWDVVGVFNWTETVERQEITPERLGLEPGEHIFYDVWNKELAGVGDSLKVLLMPASCRVISVYPKLDRPQVIGTSRHITQGADDLVEVKWDSKLQRIDGRSNVVGGDPYEVRVFLPGTWGYRASSESVVASERVVTLFIEREEDCVVDWTMEFERGERRQISDAHQV